MKNNAELRIVELGLVLPPSPKPAGVYKPALEVNKMLYVSGQVPLKNDGSLITGKLGKDMQTDDGKLAARQVGLTMLSTIKTHFGDVNRIKRIVKVLGFVNSAPDFTQQALVMNGFSELMAEVFGQENGIGARSAVGAILPNNIAVEVEAIFELYD
jgi:enamine deaminase RidA (YjgF/YER057c/UK114 family)